METNEHEFDYNYDDLTLEFVRTWCERVSKGKPKIHSKVHEKGGVVTTSATVETEMEEFKSWRIVCWEDIRGMEGIDNVHYDFPDDGLDRTLIDTTIGTFIGIMPYEEVKEIWRKKAV